MRLLKTLAVSCMLLLASCTYTQVQFNDQSIPVEVVEFAETNVFKLITQKGRGSAFWINPTTLITACHVVKHVPQGGVVLLQSYDWKLNLKATVEKCSRILDVAVIKYSGGAVEGLNPLTMELDAEPPRTGTHLYGAGYALAQRLQITQGHWGYKSDYGQMNTAPMIGGDSGSPAVTWDGKEVKIVGVRVSGMTIRSNGGAVDALTHMSFLKPTANILTVIYEDLLKLINKGK